MPLPNKYLFDISLSESFLMVTGFIHRKLSYCLDHRNDVHTIGFRIEAFFQNHEVFSVTLKIQTVAFSLPHTRTQIKLPQKHDFNFNDNNSSHKHHHDHYSVRKPRAFRFFCKNYWSLSTT